MRTLFQTMVRAMLDCPSTLKFCSCGCKELINLYDNRGRLRKFKRGHNNKESNNHFWKGGKVKHDGYWLVWNLNYLFVTKNGYVYEHRLVYEKYYNCILLPYTVIHHINGIRDDNRIENLKPMYKAKHHSLENKKNMSDRYCSQCGSKTTWFNKNNYKQWLKYKNGYVCFNCYQKNRYQKRK